MINKPPGLPFVVVFSAAAAVVLEWASYPYWYGIEMFLFTVPVGVLLLAYWAIRMVWAERKGTLEGSRGRCWIIPWIITGGVMLALVTDAPFWTRFTLSAPSMEAYAKAVAEDPDREEPCQWVGLYHVCGGRQHLDPDSGGEVPGGVEFRVQERFLHDASKGFLWLPSGEPIETVHDGYRHLKDHWYGYHDRGSR